MLRMYSLMLALTLGLTGCASWFEDDSPPPHVSLVKVEVVRAKLLEQKFKLYFRVDNRDDADLTVFLHRPELAWDGGKVVGALRGAGERVATVEAMLERLRELARPGDHLVFMSNGGFEGAPRRALAVLGAV